MRVDAFLRELLLQAGRRLKKQFGKVKSIHYKAGAATNLVTNVDEEVETFIKRRIRENFPEDGILAEESAIEAEERPRKWIIDPLDGTTNYAHGLSIFSVSIGVEESGQVTTGGVYDPIHNELFFARKGKGATLNGKRIRVSTERKLNHSLITTGFPYDIQEHPERSLPYFQAVITRAQGLRRLGSAALDLCYVAMARFDGFFEVRLQPWDTAAGVLILKEAGGKVTDFEGKPFSIYGRQMVATNGLIQNELVKILKNVRRNEN
jgi:myo-inositol-1(or 4)-monophosphatase